MMSFSLLEVGGQHTTWLPKWWWKEYLKPIVIPMFLLVVHAM